MPEPSTPDTRSTSTQPLAQPAAAPPETGVRPRPALGVWLRDLILSLAISAFIILP